MKMIKILQGAVVFVFLLEAISGAVILIFAPDKLDAYGRLMQILWPTLVTVVIPALIGTPLTEAVRNLTGKKAETVAPTEP